MIHSGTYARNPGPLARVFARRKQETTLRLKAEVREDKKAARERKKQERAAARSAAE